MRNGPEITVLLRRVSQGEKAAESELFAALYDELRALAGWFIRRERPGHTLQPTALVNEVYLRMLSCMEGNWADRAHFFRVAAKAMRRVLVDHARRNAAAKRSTVAAPDLEQAFALAPDDLAVIVTVDTALRHLEKRDPRQAAIVEMRFFGGLTEEEISLLVGISLRTVKRDWSVAKAWLKAELRAGEEHTTADY
ncbi:MAG: sigma-70 family RNA polymerase sigma factor [Acidobacteriaceae bacterium]|nr:sigma-70 family RNA polymerase sigma factor [Acidobacteriaceae bacterium]